MSGLQSFHDEYRGQDVMVRSADETDTPWVRVRLVSFTFAPSPEDWRFFFVPVPSDTFMDFWDMVNILSEPCLGFRLTGKRRRTNIGTEFEQHGR